MNLLIHKCEFIISNSLKYLKYDFLNNHKTDKSSMDHICDIFTPQSSN